MASNTSLTCNSLFSLGIPVRHFSVGLCFVIMFESLLVIATIWRTIHLHKNTDIIVASLSATDIFLCIAYVSQWGMLFFSERISQSQQRFLHCFIIGDSYSSVWIGISHLGFLAIDRYIYIGHPFYYIKNMTTGRVFKVLLAIWATGLVVAIIPLLVYTREKYNHICMLFNPPLEYLCVLFVGYIMNVIIVFTSYMKIACLAFKRQTNLNYGVRRHQRELPERVFLRSRNAAMKSARFFAVMFGVFLPLTLTSLLIPVIDVFYNIPAYLYAACPLCFLLNSFTNCLIYAFMRKEFAPAVKGVFLDMGKLFCYNIRA